MNDGIKRKVPAAFLLRGTFGEPSGYIQYPPQWLESQYSHQRSSRFIRVLGTFLIRAGGVFPPVTGRPGRQADTPLAAQRPRFARRHAQGCLRLRFRPEENPAPLDKPPEKAKPPEVRTRAASEVNW